MTEVKTLFRLEPRMLAAVRKQAGLTLSANSNTTPLEAGVQIGMARVLHILQEGFTIEQDSPSVPNTNDG
jgi:hypothetical protein